MLAILLALTLQTAPATTDFSWLSGTWTYEIEGQSSEEIWTKADGQLMTGMNRIVRDDGRTGFEFMRIELSATPTFVAQPSGGEAVRFPMVYTGLNTVVFSNPENDFPTHIAYKRDGNILAAQIWGQEGREESITWQWELNED
jgi:hypothetical protein